MAQLTASVQALKDKLARRQQKEQKVKELTNLVESVLADLHDAFQNYTLLVGDGSDFEAALKDMFSGNQLNTVTRGNAPNDANAMFLGNKTIGMNVEVVVMGKHNQGKNTIEIDVYYSFLS